MCAFEQNISYRPLLNDLISRLKNFTGIIHDSSNMVIIQALVLVAILGLYLPTEFSPRYYISLAVQKSYEV